MNKVIAYENNEKRKSPYFYFYYYHCGFVTAHLFKFLIKLI